MKKLKKLAALVLAAAMVLAMGMTSFAADPQKGQLTVNVANEGTNQGQNFKDKTIYIFKLFDLTTSGSAPSVNYDYTINNTYKAAIKEALGSSAAGYTEDQILDALSNLSTSSNPTIQKFANDFTKKIVTTDGFTGTPNTDYFTSGEITETKTEYTFTSCDYGYYLVYLPDAVEVQSSLVTVNGNDSEVNIKSEIPTVEKEADETSAQIGEVVKFTVTTKVPDTSAYTNYVFKVNDTLSDGLTFVKDAGGTALTDDNLPVKVKIGTDGTEENINATVSGQSMTLDLSLKVTTAQDKIGQEITITYYAKLNSNAVITNSKNKVEIVYSNKPGTDETGTTIPDIEKVPTFPLQIHKYETGKITEYLPGAKFELYPDNAGQPGDTAIKVTGSNGTYTVKEDQSSGDTVMETQNTEISEDAGYNLYVNGLKAGTYWLVETEAPEGFNKVKDPIKVEIALNGEDNYKLTVGDQEQSDKIAEVENKKGSMLPETGGIGTVLFTGIAVVLILGVGASFVVSRKRR